jgi:formylglycine-generating enzyme required for sulfatase activity
VTVGQFRQFVKARDYKTQAEREGGAHRHFPDGSWKQDPACNWLNPGFDQTDDHPVVCVSWHDAREFCDWLSKKEGKTYRLPTEAEWEYACRADTKSRYCCGDDKNAVKDFANVADESISQKWPGYPYPGGKEAWNDGHAFTAPVGRFKQNAFGLYDMHGNVWEWCLDGPRTYPSPPTPLPQGERGEKAVDDPRGPETAGGSRVLRGSSWNHVAWDCRSALRNSHSPSYRSYNIGFRVVWVR